MRDGRLALREAAGDRFAHPIERDVFVRGAARERSGCGRSRSDDGRGRRSGVGGGRGGALGGALGGGRRPARVEVAFEVAPHDPAAGARAYERGDVEPVLCRHAPDERAGEPAHDRLLIGGGRRRLDPFGQIRLRGTGLGRCSRQGDIDGVVALAGAEKHEDRVADGNAVALRGEHPTDDAVELGRELHDGLVGLDLCENIIRADSRAR